MGGVAAVGAGVGSGVGAGVTSGVGAGVTSVVPGDHVVTLFSPQCRECVHCRSDRTNLCLAIREQQNKGFLPDGTTRLSLDGEPMRPFMGTSTFAEYTVMPEIALAKIDREAPLDRIGEGLTRHVRLLAPRAARDGTARTPARGSPRPFRTRCLPRSGAPSLSELRSPAR